MFSAANLFGDFQLALGKLPVQFDAVSEFLMALALTFADKFDYTHKPENIEKIAKIPQYNTGHSLGAVLAELLCCNSGGMLPTVTFENPGTSTIINNWLTAHNTPANIKMEILGNMYTHCQTYLSDVNLINTCDAQLGKAFRLSQLPYDYTVLNRMMAIIPADYKLNLNYFYYTVLDQHKIAKIHTYLAANGAIDVIQQFSVGFSNGYKVFLGAERKIYWQGYAQEIWDTTPELHDKYKTFTEYYADFLQYLAKVAREVPSLELQLPKLTQDVPLGWCLRPKNHEAYFKSLMNHIITGKQHLLFTPSFVDTSNPSSAPQLKKVKIEDIKFPVFNGGGVKGAAHIAGYAALQACGLKPQQLEACAGTSAGSIVALLISLAYGITEMFSFMNELDAKFLDEDGGEKVSPKLLQSVGKVQEGKSPFFAAIPILSKSPVIASRISSHTGIFKGEALRAWFEKRTYERTGIEFCTFAELHEKRNRTPLLPIFMWLLLISIHLDRWCLIIEIHLMSLFLMRYVHPWQFRVFMKHIKFTKKKMVFVHWLVMICIPMEESPIITKLISLIYNPMETKYLINRSWVS